jgi:hypothetical protein
MSTALADAVGTLRIRAPYDDPAIRMACADAVRRARLSKRAPSSRAVLVLRSTRVRSAPNHDPAAFTAELNRQVESGWRTACPAGPAALGADAVEFRDLTQLVALYVADLVSGQAGERWWWSAISRMLAGAGDVHAVLAAHVELVPHIVVELRGTGQLGRVIASLGASACEDLVRQLAAEFAAPRLAAAVDVVRGIKPLSALAGAGMVAPPAASAGIRVQPRPDASAGVGVQPPPNASVGVGVQPPPVAATPVDDTGAMRRLLVAVALGLAMDPSDARSSRFAQETVQCALSRGKDPVPLPYLAHPPAGSGPPEPARATQPADERKLPGDAAPGRAITEEPYVDRGDDRADAEPPSAGTRFRTDNPPRDEIMSGEPTALGPPARDLADLARHPTAPIADDESPRHDLDTNPVTELGGLFFLIAPIRELRIPERFGPNGRLAERLGWWGTVELIARRLLPPDPALADDPIWALLAELGRRSAVDRARSLKIAEVRGTVVWDPDLTPVDLPSLDASLARMCRGAAVREWLDEVAPWMAGMLVSRLRCDPAELLNSMLLRRATVVHDRTHVDVYFPLASATVAVRRVGFDRDPGWVPELGRVIAFHFDDRVSGG